MPVKSVFLLSPLLFLIGLILLGGLVGMVVLLANRKTRAVGFVLMSIGLMAFVLVGGAVLSHTMSVQNVQQMEMAKRADLAQEQAVRQMERQRRLLEQGSIDEIIVEDHAQA
ncbi:MAG TPA: hypothetical protein VE890_17630, partial [Thermoguttaceae bacterium]|nr:hypothetical protein [Thermoguttaceae bacterium]